MATVHAKPYDVVHPIDTSIQAENIDAMFTELYDEVQAINAGGTAGAGTVTSTGPTIAQVMTRVVVNL